MKHVQWLINNEESAIDVVNNRAMSVYVYIRMRD